MTGDLVLAQYGFAPALASALLQSLWQNALLAVAAALALRAMARAGAASRHNVAMAFLVAMAVLPAAQFLRFWDRPAAELNEGLIPAMTAPEIGTATQVFVQQSSPVAPFVVLFWGLGAGLMLLRHAGGLRAVAAMDRFPSRPLPPIWLGRVAEMRAALGIGRAVTVRVTDRVLAPCAARLLRPVIWMPVSLVTRAPAEQIEALLAHELAHVARKDWIWNGVQCLIESLLFYHPAIWWLGRRIRQEREHACDDLAVAACGDPIALAEALAALECERHSSPRFVLAADGGSLMHRITRLLSGPPSRGRWGARAALALLSISGVLVVAQVGLAGGRWPDLEIRSSTTGALGPGDFREIRAGGLDKRRYYRASVDSRGRLSQVYEENGEARPIDARVGRWIREMTRLGAAPAAHQVDLAAIEREHKKALARLPQMPETAEYKSLVRAVAAHSAVVARLGRPAAPTARPVDGEVRLSGASGEADIEIEMQGPRGKAVFAVSGELEDRRWRLDSVTLE